MLDLMSNSAGEKLGGLSVTSLSSSVVSLSANETVLHNATALEYLIDSTPDPTEQTTFYLREFDDQSLIHAEHLNPTPATTQAVQDLLVSLEVPLSAVSNSTEPIQRMCATFNPQARGVQAFGLSLCMDERGAKNDGSASQAFRFSPDSGIVQPYYGAGESGDRMLAQVNEKIEQMDAETAAIGAHRGLETSGANSTAAVPDLVPVVIASSTNGNSTAASTPILNEGPTDDSANSTSSPAPVPSPGSQSSMTNSEAQSGTVAEATSILPVPSSTSAPALSSSISHDAMSEHALVIGNLPTNSGSSGVSVQGLGNHAGLVMIFHRIGDHDSRPQAKDTTEAGAPGRRRMNRRRRVVRAVRRNIRRSNYAEDDFSESSERVIHEGLSGAPKTTVTAKEVYPSLDAHSAAHSSTSTTSPPVSPNSNQPNSVPPSLGAGKDKSESSSRTGPTFGAEDLDKPLPKPVVNVAYFGDSGRSAPVPPEDQADSKHPILLADHGSRPNSSKPMHLATTEPAEPDFVEVFLISPKAKSAGREASSRVMAAMGKSKDKAVHGGMGSKLPIDASD